MDIEEKIIKELKKIVEDLVNKDYEKIISTGRCQRITDEEIKEEIQLYGGELTKPPEDGYYSKALRMMKFDNGFEYDLAFDLWVDGERSDLSIACNVVVKGDKVENISIYDIHTF